MYDAVIFDKDGVILDSGLNNFLWIDHVRMKKASELGYDLTEEESISLVKTKDVNEVERFLSMKGMTWEDLIEIEKAVRDTKIRMIEQGVIRIFPETRRIMESLKQDKALVTNAPHKAAEFTLDYFSLSDYFDSVHAMKVENLKEYYQRKKPHPDMINQAMRKLDAENPLMVGDSSADVIAAQNAGIDSALIPNYREYPELNPTYRIRDLIELKNILSNPKDKQKSNIS